MERRFQAFQIPVVSSDLEFPGVGVSVVLKLIPQSVFRRKYILDLAKEFNRNRISLFLDANNIMTFELLDTIGETYNVKISPKEYEFNKWMMIHCEYGKSNEFSFMRIFINNKLVEQSKFRFKIELPDNLQKQMSLGSDISGTKGIGIEMTTYLVFGSTLTNRQRNNQFNFFQQHYGL